MIRWYERAAGESLFHSSLKDVLEKHLEKSLPVLELGCGLGHIAELLHADGYSITAGDIDRRALEAAAKRSGLSIFRYLDAEGRIPWTEQILMIFFGKIDTEARLFHYLSCCRRLVIVHSEHRWRESSADKLRQILTASGVPFAEESCRLSFNQPFSSDAEAESFVRTYYPEQYRKEMLSSIRNTNDNILKNDKSIYVFDIMNKENK